MEASNPELGLLAARIAKLESQIHLWKLAGLIATLLLAFSFVAGVGAQQRPGMFIPPAKELKAESFVLTDANGVTKGEFSTKNGSPILELYGPTGAVIWSTNPGPRTLTEGH
jgi:hypothetical protein